MSYNARRRRRKEREIAGREWRVDYCGVAITVVVEEEGWRSGVESEIDLLSEEILQASEYPESYFKSMTDSRHGPGLEQSLVHGGGKVDLKVSGRLLVLFLGLGFFWFSGCNQLEAETPAEVSAMIQVPNGAVWQRVSLRMDCSVSV